MHKNRIALLTLLFFCCLGSVVAQTILDNSPKPGSKSSFPSSTRPRFATDRIKIKLSKDAIRLANLPTGLYAEATAFNINELDQLLRVNGGEKIIRAHRQVKDTSWEKSTGFHRWFLITLDGKTSVEQAIKSFKANRYIEEATPEYIAYTTAVPNDTYYAINGLGVTGVAGGCSVMPLKIASADGSLTFTAIENALTHCGENNVDVASMSFGAEGGTVEGDSPSTDAALEYATEYQVFRSTEPYGSYELIATTTTPLYYDNLPPDTAFYRLKAVYAPYSKTRRRYLSKA